MIPIIFLRGVEFKDNAKPPPKAVPRRNMKHIDRAPGVIKVGSAVDCCSSCASSSRCSHWTFGGGSCHRHQLGAEFITLTGLSNEIVSGNIEFSLRNDLNLDQNSSLKTSNWRSYILSMEPMRYLHQRAGYSSLKHTQPSSWLEQWPIGCFYIFVRFYIISFFPNFRKWSYRIARWRVFSRRSSPCVNICTFITIIKIVGWNVSCVFV